MADVVVLGAGLGGALMRFDLADTLRSEDHLTLIGQDASYRFVPSNPWVAVGWRKPAEKRVEMAGGQGIPALFLFRHGVIAAQATGAMDATAIVAWVRRHATDVPTTTGR